MAAVKDVDVVLTTVKGNVEEMSRILASWESSLLFERKEGKTYSERELKDLFHAIITQRHKEIQDNGKQLVKLLSNSNRTLKANTHSVSLLPLDSCRLVKLLGHGRLMSTTFLIL